MKIVLIALNEWRALTLSRAFLILGGLVLVLTAYTIVAGAMQYKQVHAHREEARGFMRQKFLGQGEVNPHSAAHYGHFVFKPHAFLHVFDPGVEKYVGTTLRLEGHRQNEAAFATSQSQSSLVRFGELAFVLLLQVIFPLLIIFTCHRAVVDERASGTLKLLQSQGITMRQLLWGKIFGYTLVYLLLLLVCVVLFLLVIRFISVEPQGAGWQLLLLPGIYGIYYFILIMLTVYLSAWARTAGAVLVNMLGIWFLFTVIVPKAAANIGEQLAPLPSKLAVDSWIQEANRNGIDGHDPKNKRVEELKEALLTKYGVEDLKALPVNADGVIMQEDEEYHNMVYDRSFGALQDTIRRQNSIGSLAAVAAPFLAIRNLSMAVAQTDVYHHFHFLQEAENYRRHLIKQLNDEHAYGGSRTGDWDWKVSASYWQGIEDFTYQPPGISWALSQRMPELMALGIWVLGLLLLIQFTSPKIPVL